MQAYTFFRYTVAPEEKEALNRALTDFMCNCGPGWILTLAASTKKVSDILDQHHATIVEVKPRTS